MELTLKRIYCKEDYTIGKLYIDGEFFCDTIEDRERVLNSAQDKVYGETAIPRGKYRVSITWSNRFKRMLPELHNVPYFEGVRIHRGNTADQSSGCILVGENKMKGGVINSKIWEEKLLARFNESKDNYHYILITGK